VKDLVASLGIAAKVEILDRVSYQKALEMMAASKAGFSLHQPTYNFLRGLPLKLLEYAGMGTPVIASNIKNFRQIVDSGACGICVNPNNIDEIANAMHFLIADENRRQTMAINGKQLVKNKYNWESEGPKIITAIKTICG
jgi:glycosyltransferase involved in cell wall biosynthesis